jgi:hypothetical protein
MSSWPGGGEASEEAHNQQEKKHGNRKNHRPHLPLLFSKKFSLKLLLPPKRFLLSVNRVWSYWSAALWTTALGLRYTHLQFKLRAALWTFVEVLIPPLHCLPP